MNSQQTISPNFNSTYARVKDKLTGASTCVLGDRKLTENIDIL